MTAKYISQYVNTTPQNGDLLLIQRGNYAPYLNITMAQLKTYVGSVGVSFAAITGSPYDNANLSSALSGISNAIPTNNNQLTNGAGYITSTALTPYLLSSTAASTYLTQTVASSTYATLTALALKAPLASPTFTGTVTLPAGQVVNGVTLVTNLGTSMFLRGDGTYGAASGGGGGTVTTVSVATANGFAGTVANASTTPAITLTTSITGLLKGNGTAISAAAAGTDYQAPITLTTTGTSGAATFAGGTLNIPNYATGGGGNVTGAGTTTMNAIGKWGNTTGTSLVNSGVLIDASNNITGAGTVASADHTITSATATALTVGLNGATNPALLVDASTASSVTGVAVKSATANATISAISSGSNCDLILTSKGFSTLYLRSPNFVQMQVGGSTVFQGTNAQNLFQNAVRSANTSVLFQGVAGTALTASTEILDVDFAYNVNMQHAVGALSLQRQYLFRAQTLAFTAASTCTLAATLNVDSAVIAGTNATITSSAAIYSPGGAVGSAVGTSYGAWIIANTGATNNYAARFDGAVNANGSMSHAIRVVTAAGAITVGMTDYTVVVNKTTGAATAVTLSTPPTGYSQTVIVKDGKGDANTNNITVTPASGLIDGQANKVINTNNASIKFHWDGAAWWII